MSRRYDCANDHERTRGMAEAVTAVGRGQLVVLPTDTVYGIGCDAFKPDAVKALLDAKGRGRDLPAPVLVGSVRAAEALIEDLDAYGQDLVDEFWPGPLTIVCRASSTLAWDLGDTKGTVAVRMPLHPTALELLKRTGPMAVSSANASGSPPARTAEDAEAQLGDSVEVYLDDGPSGDTEPSSIVDLTGPVPRLLRSGAIPEGRLRDVCGVLITVTPDDEPASDEPEDTADGEPVKPETTTGDEPADGDKPEGAVGDKPADGDKRATTTGDKPANGDEPESAVADKPAGDDKPEGVTGDKPASGDEPKGATGDKPAGATGDRPVGGDEPEDATGDKPAGGDKPGAAKTQKDA